MAASEAYIERLQQLDEAQECQLLDAILREGFDQGCFVRADEEQLVPFGPGEVGRVLDALRERPLARATGNDPYPDGRPVEPIAGEKPGFVVLTQRCDLIAGFVVEPFVELAQVVCLRAGSDEARSARLNSARLLALVEDDERLWAADLRIKALLPKDVLPTHNAVNIVPLELRDRLRLRLGQRFSRQALPVDLVEKLQRPLIKVLGRNPTTRRLGAIFTDWLVVEEEDRFRLLAVVSRDYSQRQGDDAYQQLAEHIPPETEALLSEQSGAITMEDLNFLTWLTALKINLDEISWHPTKGVGQAEPTR